MSIYRDRYNVLMGIVELTEKMEKSTDERARLMVQARLLGVPVRNIAEVANVSPQTVLNIVARFTATDD